MNTGLIVAISVLLTILAFISFIDARQGIIPDKLLLFLLIPSTYLAIQTGLSSGLTAFFLGGLLFLLMAIFSGGGVGGGDIKLVSVLGLALGVPGLVVTLGITFILGLTGSIAIKLLKRQSGLDSTIPLAPYITMGVVMTICWGDKIINSIFKGGVLFY